MLGLLAAFLPCELNGSQGLPATVIAGDRGRVVFPSSADVGSGDVQRLLKILDKEVVARGFPPPFRLDRFVTISLAVEQKYSDADAWTRPDAALIVLPLEGALGWGEEKLRRVLRHELTHVRLGAFLGGHHGLPRWFEEGLAEWAAGGVTCEGEWRLRIDVRRRRMAKLPLPKLDGDWSSVPKRIAYDYYATFFEYVESRRPGLVARGDLISLVKEHGVESALRIGLGTDRLRIERAWDDHLEQLVESRC